VFFFAIFADVLCELRGLGFDFVGSRRLLTAEFAEKIRRVRKEMQGLECGGLVAAAGLNFDKDIYQGDCCWCYAGDT
jgi:hypothetical protein